jgi:nucleoside-diphosphate-sugar epimerase
MTAIIGAAGAIGRVVAADFQSRGVQHRVIGRDRAKLERDFGGTGAEIVPADIADARAAEAALSGVTTAIYAVGLPYPQFAQHPLLMRAAIDAARRGGVGRLAIVSSVYSYGVPQTGRVPEDHPREPQARKGLWRKEQEDIALAADGRDGLRTLVLRLPDFYGPGAENSLADLVFRSAMGGKTATWLGDPDLPHEFVYVPDVPPVLATLIEREGSFGRAWNFGGPGTITGREFIAEVFRLAGRKPKIRAVGRTMLRVAGLFHGLMRELVELHYLGMTPVILDDSRLERHLGGLAKTPYADGIRRTWEWYRSR